MDPGFLDNKRQVKVKFLKAINLSVTEFSVSLLFVQKKVFRPINYKLSKVTDGLDWAISSCLQPPFQSEAWCTRFRIVGMNMSFICM